jgi:hypothetical protein
MAEVGGQYSFLVNGAQHVALNITVTAADMYMQTALKSLERSINNGTFVDRLNASGVQCRLPRLARRLHGRVVLIPETKCLTAHGNSLRYFVAQRRSQLC